MQVAFSVGNHYDTFVRSHFWTTYDTMCTLYSQLLLIRKTSRKCIKRMCGSNKEFSNVKENIQNLMHNGGNELFKWRRKEGCSFKMLKLERKSQSSYKWCLADAHSIEDALFSALALGYSLAHTYWTDENYSMCIWIWNIWSMN